MYAETASKEGQPSLMDDAGRVVGRLHECYQRLVDLGDHLHGPSPRSAQVSGDKPEPTPSIGRHIANAHRGIDEIWSELDRITARM